jgi:hypothetical protein
MFTPTHFLIQTMLIFFYVSVLDYGEDVLIKRIAAWRWTTNQVWACQHKIAVQQVALRWSYHAKHSPHLDYTSTKKSFYYRSTNAKWLILHSIKRYDSLIQHRDDDDLVWVLKDVKVKFAYDPVSKNHCKKMAILIRVSTFCIITHIPVWEYGCAKV